MSRCLVALQLKKVTLLAGHMAQPGTQAYFQCRMLKEQQRQANNAALAAAILNRPQPYVLPMPQRY